MQLAMGDKLGPYEILAELGQGGMGEVYRARDSRVGREVAVKISAEQFSERFGREARAVAALNHPNICTLHDVGPNYLVMELVEGEPPKGPLPLETALAYARQIADALDAAHEKGIIHRDLKPGNIKIRGDGTVKVLDFGLAKIIESRADLERSAGPEGPAYMASNSPTLTGGTLQGMILGTAAYMAPEQARGKVVDKRADIWAFGAVLYEMVTGRRAFDGEDVSSILAAVIQSDPSWDGVPARLRPLLERCLQKEPRKRLRDIGDVWQLLDAGGTSGSHDRRSGLAPWIAAAVFAVAAAAALWAPWRSAPRPAAQQLVRLDVELGTDVSLVPLNIPSPRTVAISPDGNRLAYVANVAGGPMKLLTRRLDQPTATELAGTEAAASPFFSPDGRWIGFFDGQKVNKVSVEGGAVVPLSEFGIMAGASWGDDGNIIVGSGLMAGLMRVSANGGKPEPVLELGPGELFHGTPQILPGGKALLVAAYGTPPSVENAVIDIVTIADRRRKTLVRGGTSPRYLASGHLVYTNKATMFAVPFDLEKLEARGTAVPILTDVAYDGSTGALAQFDVSLGGTLVYRSRSGAAAGLMNVQWLDATGKFEPLVPRPGTFEAFAQLSPDGRRIALTVNDAGQEIWVYDTQRDAMTRLTFGGGAYTAPIWSPDGRYVVFSSIGQGIYWARSDGAGRPQPLMSSKSIQLPNSYASDGKRIAYFQVDGVPQIWTVPVEEKDDALKAGKPERFLTTPFADSGAAFSPDRRWMAYVSLESGRPEVYVRAFGASSSAKWQISNSGGVLPKWSPGGRELLYLAGDQIMSVEYTVTGDSFAAGKPRAWAAKAIPVASFDPAPDGKRLAVITPVATSTPRQEHTVVFLQNFFDELRRRAPLDR